MFLSHKRNRTQVGRVGLGTAQILAGLSLFVFTVGIAFLTYYCFVRPSSRDANNGVTASDDDAEVCGPRGRPFGSAQITDRAREVWCLQEYELGERMNLLTVVMIVGDSSYRVLSVREFLPTREILLDLLPPWERLCGTGDLVGMQFSSNMRNGGQGIAAWCLSESGTLDVRYTMTWLHDTGYAMPALHESLFVIRTIPMAEEFRIKTEFVPPRGIY